MTVFDREPSRSYTYLWSFHFILPSFHVLSENRVNSHHLLEDCQAVVRQSSGSRQAVVRQSSVESSDIGLAVIRKLLCRFEIVIM